MESSGTRWVTDLLSKHPRVTEAVHTSIPEYLMCHDIKTRWPDLTGADAVVWMLRYEPFRLMSVERAGYNKDRPIEFLQPYLYENCARLYRTITSPVHFVSYSGLLGPLGPLVFENLLRALTLDPAVWPVEIFKPADGNAQYLSGQD